MAVTHVLTWVTANITDTLKHRAYRRNDRTRDEERPQKSLSVRMDDYIAMPFNPHQLQAVLGKYLKVLPQAT